MRPSFYKKVIITGASKGLGLKIAQVLKGDFALGFLCRSKPDVKGHFINCDFNDPMLVDERTNTLINSLRGVDVLINNVGAFFEGSIENVGLMDWQRIQNINLISPSLVTKRVVSFMMRNGGGKIINIVSTAGIEGKKHQTCYCASKHGLVGFFRALSLEVKEHNIQIFTICPGGLNTDFTKGTKLYNELKKQKLINPYEVAQIVRYLTVVSLEDVGYQEIVIRR